MTESSIEVQSHNFALITLKERCHFLKQQLRAVDEENIKLKVQIASASLPKENKPLVQVSLIEEIEQLKKQKEQLSNQIHILATENNNMWSRLSKLTVLNKNLSRRFTSISDTLKKYGIRSAYNEGEVDINSASESEDCRKTLEEMSLKLINEIKLEKTELEKQYAQMVDLHRSDINGISQDLAFSSIAECDEDSVMAAVRKHSQKLNQLKSSLEQQQALLVVTLKDLKQKQNEQLNNKVVNVAQRDASTEPIVRETVRAVPITPTVEVANNSPDVITDDEQKCPMCAIVIPGTIQLFIDHVSEHFDNVEENDASSFIHLS